MRLGGWHVPGCIVRCVFVFFKSFCFGGAPEAERLDCHVLSGVSCISLLHRYLFLRLLRGKGLHDLCYVLLVVFTFCGSICFSIFCDSGTGVFLVVWCLLSLPSGVYISWAAVRDIGVGVSSIFWSFCFFCDVVACMSSIVLCFLCHDFVGV